MALTRADQAGLLALLAFRHYLYPWLPRELWGDVYGLFGALCIMAAVGFLPLWWPIKAWAMGEELLTAGCTAAWMGWPQWFTAAFEDERCSQAVGFRVGSIGLCVLAIISWRLSTAQVCSSEEEKRG